jgi:hypothetical protein
VGIVILYYIGGLAAVRRTRYHIDTHDRRYPYARGYAQRGVLAIGSAYFTISAPPHVASLPSYFSGSQITSSVSASSTVDTVADVVIDVAGNHWAGCVVNFNNLDVSQSLAWTSSVDIPAGDAVLQGTAGISCIIT